MMTVSWPSAAMGRLSRIVSMPGSEMMFDEGAMKPTDIAPIAMSSEPRKPLTANSATRDERRLDAPAVGGQHDDIGPEASRGERQRCGR